MAGFQSASERARIVSRFLVCARIAAITYSAISSDATPRAQHRGVPPIIQRG
jgi:hypothetical protein